MKIIGITGGIGSGKSEVMRFLGETFDAETVRADEVGRDLMQPGTACFDSIVALFGPDCLGDDGCLNRRWISERVFRVREDRERLNAIIHPAVREEITKRIRAAGIAGRAYFFVEAALLIEEHYDEICDELWYIYAREDVRIRRVLASRDQSEESVRSVMKSQLSEEAFRSGCAFTIDNSGSFEDTKRQILERIKTEE